MISVEQVIKGLNSPSDWAVALAAGTAGFAVDAAINIIPLPIFSPGICAALAMSSAMAVKRGTEATVDGIRSRRRAGILLREGEKICERYRREGAAETADDLEFDIKMAPDIAAQEQLIRWHRRGSRRMMIDPPPSLLESYRAVFERTYGGQEERP